MVVEPESRLRARTLEYECSESYDEARRFGERYEAGRLDDLAVLGPAHERFERNDLAGLRIDDRLVGDVDRAAIERAA